MTAVKIAIVVASLLATAAYCEWGWAKFIPVDRRGEAIAVWGCPIFVNFSFLFVSSLLIMYVKISVFPDSYFAPKRFEREGCIYRHTGIQLLVAFFRFIGYERLVRKEVSVRNDLEALRLYAETTRGADAIHMLSGICTAVFTIVMGLKYPLISTTGLWIGNVIVNLYPVMLQRYNRPRVERLIRRLELNSKSNSTEPSDPQGAAE